MNRLKRLTAKMLGKTFTKVLEGGIKDYSNMWIGVSMDQNIKYC